VQCGNIGVEPDPATETVDHKESSDLAYAGFHLGEGDELVVEAIEDLGYVGILEDTLGPHVGVIGNIAQWIGQILEAILGSGGPVYLCGFARGRAGTEWR